MRGLENDDTKPSHKRVMPTVILGVILLVSIGLMYFDHTSNTFQPLRDTISVAIEPLQAAAQLPASAWQFVDRHLHRDQVLAENKELKQRLLLLRGQLQKLAALQAENDRIRALIQSPIASRSNTLIAEILDISPGPYRHVVTIDKGSPDGVAKGETVVDATGIMGQIIQTSFASSTAILITDANQGIPVEINRTGLQTIAQGTGKADTLSLPFLPANADVKAGDLLVSSGLGGRYPPNYPVAKVTRVTHPTGSDFLAVQATPTASMNHGREVLIVASGNRPEAQRAHAANPAVPGSTTNTGKQPRQSRPEQQDAPAQQHNAP